MCKQPVLHIISGDLWGGAEAQVLMQVAALRTLGIPAEVLLFNEGEVSRRLRLAEIPLHIVPEANGCLRFLRRALHEIARHTPKIIVAHGYKEAVIAALASCRVSVPWIAVFHGTSEQLPGLRGLKLRGYRFIHRVLARSTASRIVTVSQTVAEELGFASLPKTKVIRNVTSAPRPYSEAAQSLQHPAIVVLGRLVPVKRVDRAIRAFSVLYALRESIGAPLPRLYIVGEGPLKAELQAAAAKTSCSENIFFLGYRDDAEELLAEADILLLTSDSEGAPTVLLEAIAAGTPAVCSKVGGIPEVLSLVPDFPGQVFSGDDIEAAAALMAELLEKTPDPELLERAKRQFEQNFLPEVAARAHQELYQERS